MKVRWMYSGATKKYKVYLNEYNDDNFLLSTETQRDANFVCAQLNIFIKLLERDMKNMFNKMFKLDEREN